MKEIFDIIKAYDVALTKGQQCALATVVQVEGSSYRRPGARMLVTDDGMLTGAISGGCLEGDALRKALLVMQQQQTMLVTYDTTDEDDAKLGVQLGCNGIVHILFEPVKREPGNAVDLLKKIAAKRQDAAIVTLFSLQHKKSSEAGTYALMTEESRDSQLPLSCLEDMQQALQNKCSYNRTYGDMNALIQYVPPAISLVVFGAGNDVVPLIQMASVLGWHLTVADGRSSHATSARFPLAQQVYVVKPQDVSTRLQFDRNTAVILMTHNYNYDLAVLQHVISLPIAYIGMLGPKTKLLRMISDIEQGGTNIDDEQLLNVYGQQDWILEPKQQKKLHSVYYRR